MRGKERIPKEEETQVTGEAAVGENYFVAEGQPLLRSHGGPRAGDNRK